MRLEELRFVDRVNLEDRGVWVHFSIGVLCTGQYFYLLQ